MPRDFTKVIEKIDLIASKVYSDLENSEIPHLKLPTRTKSNIQFDEKS